MKHVLATSVRGLALLMAMATGWSGVEAQIVTAVPKLDLDQFTGTWYVIARMPEKRDKRCVKDSILMVALGDKDRSVQLLDACKDQRGFTIARNTDGHVEDKTGDGRLKVRTIWPFSKKLWILALEPRYAWALVGSPNHKTLTVLSRTASLQPEVVTEIQSRAAAQGFSVGKLTVQPQEAQYKTE